MRRDPLFDGLLNVVDCSGEHDFSELAVPCSRSDGKAVRALDYRVHGLGPGSLLVEFVLDPSVVHAIIRCEDAMLDHRFDAFSTKLFPAAHVAITHVGGETPQVALRNAGDLRADLRPIRPLCAAIEVDNRAGHGIVEKRSLDGLYFSLTPFEVVVRRLSAVKVGGVDGGVAGLVELLLQESAQLSPDPCGCSVKRLTERR